MTEVAQLHDDQVAYWNGAGGLKWISAHERTDIVLRPIADALLSRAGSFEGATIIDVGCGCGATTAQLAEKAGQSGRVVGLDVSRPILDCAAKSLACYHNVKLICADAASYEFTPSADLIFSRFGVMFFGDPIAAFGNLRRALKPGGRMLFACWRKLEDNPWMNVPLQAVYAHVPPLPRPQPGEPGPFSFANPERVAHVLTSAGFTPPRMTPLDLPLDIAAGGGLGAAVIQSATIGASSRALQDQPDEIRVAALASIEAALTPFVKGETVLLGSAIWIVECEPAGDNN